MVQRLRTLGYSERQIQSLKAVYGSGGAPAVEALRQTLEPEIGGQRG